MPGVDMLLAAWPAAGRNGGIARMKATLARPDMVLIDDSLANIEAYKGRHGPVIPVPRPWNPLHSLTHRAAEVVRRELERLVEREAEDDS